MRLGLVACVAAAAAFAPVAARADGRGNSNYQGAYSSSTPSDYRPSPQWWPRGSQVTYDFTVTDNQLFVFSGAPSGDLYAQRVTSVDGTDVSSGDPAESEDAVLDGQLGGDAPVDLGPIDPTPIPGGSSRSYRMVVPASLTAECGYLVVWVGTTPDRTDGTWLNEGATRVVGCPATARAPAPRSATGSSHAVQTTSRTPAAPAPTPTATPAPQASPTPGEGGKRIVSGIFPPLTGSHLTGGGIGPPPLLGQFDVGQNRSGTLGINGPGSVVAAVVVVGGLGLAGALIQRDRRRQRRGIAAR